MLLSLVGTALFTPVFAIDKLAGTVFGIEAPTLAIVALGYLGAWLGILAAVVATRTPLRTLASPRPGRHLLRACFGVGGTVCAIHAAAVLPVARATAIGLTDGLIVVALAALVLGERVTRAHWIAGATCAAGALVVTLQPGVGGAVADAVGGTGAVLGVAAAFAGAVFIALETIYVAIISREESALGMLSWVVSFAVLVTTGSALAAGALTAETVAAAWPLMLIGPVAATGQLCFILAFRQADASVLGPINYSWILFSALLGWAVFDEVPSAGTALGAVLVVVGGVALARLPSGGPARR